MPERKLDHFDDRQTWNPPCVCDPRGETADESEKESKDVHTDEWVGGRLSFHASGKF